MAWVLLFSWLPEPLVAVLHAPVPYVISVAQGLHLLYMPSTLHTCRCLRLACVTLRCSSFSVGVLFCRVKISCMARQSRAWQH